MTGFSGGDFVENDFEREDPADSDATYGFVMLYTQNLFQYLDLLKTKELRPRDFSVLFALMTFVNTKTGRCHATLKHIASVIECNSTSVYSSVARLRKHLMLATYVSQKTGEKSYLINPFILAVGGKSRRIAAHAMFRRLIES